jgi:hypothetical protein
MVEHILFSRFVALARKCHLSRLVLAAQPFGTRGAFLNIGS